MDRSILTLIFLLVLLGFLISEGIELYQENIDLRRQIEELTSGQNQRQLDLDNCQQAHRTCQTGHSETSNLLDQAKDDLIVCWEERDYAKAELRAYEEASLISQDNLDRCTEQLTLSYEQAGVQSSREEACLQTISIQESTIQALEEELTACLQAQNWMQPETSTSILVPGNQVQAAETSGSTIEEHAETIATGALGLLATLLTGMLTSAAKKPRK